MNSKRKRTPQRLTEGKAKGRRRVFADVAVGRQANRSRLWRCSRGDDLGRPLSVRRCRVAPSPTPHPSTAARPSPTHPSNKAFIHQSLVGERRRASQRPRRRQYSFSACFLLLGRVDGGAAVRPPPLVRLVVFGCPYPQHCRLPPLFSIPTQSLLTIHNTSMALFTQMMKRRLLNEKIITKREKVEEELEEEETMEEKEEEEEGTGKVPKMEEGKEQDEEGINGEEREEGDTEQQQGQAKNGTGNGKSEGSAMDSAFPAIISSLFGTHPLCMPSKRKRPSHRRRNEQTFCHPTNVSQGKFDARDTRNFNSSLVEEVSRHPALFDFTRDEYKSTEARNRHWGDVAAEMNQTVEFVRTRWKTLRDRFKKEVRRQHQCVEGPIWQHYEKMLYLLPFIRDKDDSAETGTTASNGSVGIRSKNAARRAEGATDNGIDLGTTVWHGDREQNERTSGHNGNLLHPAPINSCTAAILDLAMNAVTKLSPPPTDEVPLVDGRQFASCAEGMAGQAASSCSSSSDIAGSSSSTTSSSGGTAIVTTSLLRPFSCASLPHAHQQRTHMTKRPKINAGVGAEGGEGVTADTKWQQDDRDEDELFCKIVYRKLGRIGDERLKEYTKARIIDLLVEVQYGGGGAAAGTGDESSAYQ